MFSLANSPSESASRTGELNSSLNADASFTVVIVGSGFGAGLPDVQRGDVAAGGQVRRGR